MLDMLYSFYAMPAAVFLHDPNICFISSVVDSDGNKTTLTVSVDGPVYLASRGWPLGYPGSDPSSSRGPGPLSPQTWVVRAPERTHLNLTVLYAELDDLLCLYGLTVYEGKHITGQTWLIRSHSSNEVKIRIRT